MAIPLLFTPIQLRNTEIKNRLWFSPSCQYSVDNLDGIATDWHLQHLGSIAAGGAGAVILEATAVTPNGRISPRDLGLWGDEQVPALRRIVDFLHRQGTVAGVQLAHAGRKAGTWHPWGAAKRGSVSLDEGGWQTVSVTAEPYPGLAAPVALDAEGIAQLVQSFAFAARRAVAAGFDLIELHAAHGYLLHQFLSPLSNTRTDDYGGYLSGRVRFLAEVVAAVRAEIGERVLAIRFSGSDYAPGGLVPSDIAQAVALLPAGAVDFLDISGGGLVAHQSITPSPGYQAGMAREIRELTGIPSSAVGLITSGSFAEELLGTGIDVILASREFLRDPHFANRAAAELGLDTSTLVPPQYQRAPFSIPEFQRSDL